VFIGDAAQLIPVCGGVLLPSMIRLMLYLIVKLSMLYCTILG